MIKRPLLWILGAFLSGMYLSWLRCNTILLILIVLIIAFLLVLLLYVLPFKHFRPSDRFLMLLPLFLLLGHFNMKSHMEPPKLDSYFDEEITCQITGEVSMLVDKPKSIAIYLKNNRITLPNEDPLPCEKIIVYTSEVKDYRIGNQLTVLGSLQKFAPASNPGQFNEELHYKMEGIDYKLKAKEITITDDNYSGYYQLLYRIKKKLANAYLTVLGEKEAGAVIAMLLGEKYLLGEELNELYQENGIAHILAISGLHISLIGMTIFQILRRLKAPLGLATFVSIIFIYSYGVMTNFSVSTNRAVVMMVVMLLAANLGKTYDMLSATALSALIILLQNPLQLLSAGFQLSFAAVLGIAILLPCLKQLFPYKNSLLNGLLISISAQAATTPFVLYYFYQYPVYGVFTNLIILPFVTILTLTSILAGILAAIYLPLGIFAIGGANYILKFYEGICRLGSVLPRNLITVGRPDQVRLLIYTLLVFLFIVLVRKFENKLASLLLVIATLILLLPQRGAGLEVTFLDVGQGDAIYMKSKEGTTFFVDGGSANVKKLGTYRLEPFLLSQGTDHIDYAMITHSDKDHISGILDLIERQNILINNLVLPNIKEKDEDYIRLESLAKEKGINVVYLSAGDTISDGGLNMVCIHPTANYLAASTNASSMVLSVTYGEFDLLLTGDLEGKGEKQVLEALRNTQLQDSDYDILKVAHHGSKYSTTLDFLELTKPELAIISCSRDNKKVTRLIQFRFTCSALKWLNTRVYVASYQEIVRDLWVDIRLHTSDWNRVCCFCTTALTI